MGAAKGVNPPGVLSMASTLPDSDIISKRASMSLLIYPKKQKWFFLYERFVLCYTFYVNCFTVAVEIFDQLCRSLTWECPFNVTRSPPIIFFWKSVRYGKELRARARAKACSRSTLRGRTGSYDVN